MILVNSSGLWWVLEDSGRGLTGLTEYNGSLWWVLVGSGEFWWVLVDSCGGLPGLTNLTILLCPDYFWWVLVDSGVFW
jgi:hypothetical protein